jgi:hypothetical protein
LAGSGQFGKHDFPGKTSNRKAGKDTHFHVAESFLEIVQAFVNSESCSSGAGDNQVALVAKPVVINGSTYC